MAEIKIPNNSFSSKSSLDSTTQGKKPEEKKFSKVTTGKVTVKKKSNAKKLADSWGYGTGKAESCKRFADSWHKESPLQYRQHCSFDAFL